MKYERIPYQAPGAKSKKRSMMFGGDVEMPVFDYPVPAKENFMRAAKHQNPLWVPIGAAELIQSMGEKILADGKARFDMDVDKSDFKDDFGVKWTFVKSAGGPMLKPGTQFMDDICDWKEKVKFPDLEQYDWDKICKDFLKEANYTPEDVLHVDINQGCTERLVALMGGYTDGMVAMAMEPETVAEFFEAFVDWEIAYFDKFNEHLPLDMITYHDDWGTERDTFFSSQMMDDIVFKPTKRLFDHIHNKGVLVELHSCGRIERFLPYMVELGCDFLQIQPRANDMKMIAEKYGDKLGLECYIMPEEGKSIIDSVHEYVDNFAHTGGLFATVASKDPKESWEGNMELYCYSREFYDREQGRA